MNISLVIHISIIGPLLQSLLGMAFQQFSKISVSHNTSIIIVIVLLYIHSEFLQLANILKNTISKLNELVQFLPPSNLDKFYHVIVINSM